MEDIEMTADNTEEVVESEETIEADSSVAEGEGEVEADFTDTDTEGDTEVVEETETIVEEVEATKKPKQTSKENAEFAKRRREAEKQKAIDEAVKQAKIDTYIKAVKVNRFTGEPLEDEYDIQVLEAMEEYEAKGGDPVTDQAKIIKSLHSKTKAEKAKQAEYEKDMADFKKSHPDVNIKELFDDAKFEKFCKGKIGNMPLSEIYADYVDFYPTASKTIDVEVKKAAVKKASVGSVKGQAVKQRTKYTSDVIDHMSEQELIDNLDDVLADLSKNKRR